MDISFNESKKIRISYTIHFVIYFAVLILLGMLLLWAGGGAENPQNLTAYISYIVIGIGILAVGFFMNTILPFALLKKKTFEILYLHNPQEMGLPILNRWSWVKNPYKLALMSFVLFVPLYIFAAAASKKTIIGSIAHVSFQVSPSVSALISGEPIAFAESLVISLFAGLGFYFTMRTAVKYPRAKIIIIIFGLTLAFLAAWIGAYTLHNYVYQGKEFELASVAVFFFINVLIMMAVGSIIPVDILHFLNNTTGEALKGLGKDFVTLFLIWFEFVFIVLLVVVIAYGFRKRKKMGISAKGKSALPLILGAIFVFLILFGSLAYFGIT